MKKSTHEYREYDTNRYNNFWGAVFGGLITALSVLLLLNLLGIGIGFASINPLQESNPMQGLGTGSIIWWVITNLIALLAGGFVAGRISGASSKNLGGIHGFVSWGIYALISVWLVFSGVGSIIGGVTGAAANLFSNNQKEINVNLENRKKSEQTTKTSLEDVKSSIMKAVRLGERYEVLPEEASGEVHDVLNQNRIDVKEAMRELNVEENVERFFNNLEFNLDDQGNLDITVEGDGEYFKKADLKEYMAENTSLSESEIEGMINKWERQIDEAVQKAEELYQKAMQKVEEAAAKTADAIAKFSIWAFIALLLGAAVAYFGGTLGSRNRNLKTQVVDRTETT
jgi:gas vesicle protein